VLLVQQQAAVNSKMVISELKAGQGNVNVEGVIKEIGDTRVFNKFGKELKVANAILTDESGSIKLTLWNNDVAKFSAGDKIKITNGYVGEFQGEKQLTSGKFGKIEKTGEKDISEMEVNDSSLEDAPVGESEEFY
jgi:replication factor A1